MEEMLDVSLSDSLESEGIDEMLDGEMAQHPDKTVAWEDSAKRELPIDESSGDEDKEMRGLSALYSTMPSDAHGRPSSKIQANPSMLNSPPIVQPRTLRKKKKQPASSPEAQPRTLRKRKQRAK